MSKKEKKNERKKEWIKKKEKEWVKKEERKKRKERKKNQKEKKKTKKKEWTRKKKEKDHIEQQNFLKIVFFFLFNIKHTVKHECLLLFFAFCFFI